MKTSLIGTATRIYKNANDKAIAVDALFVKSDEVVVKNQVFYQPASLEVKRTHMHLDTDRVIAKIEMIGDYSSIFVDGGNYSTMTFLAPNAGGGDITISMSHLPKIGDTIP